jgi:hypothetical protein
VKEIELAICDVYGRIRILKICERLIRRLANKEGAGGVLGCEFEIGWANRYNHRIKRFEILPSGTEYEDDE